MCLRTRAHTRVRMQELDVGTGAAVAIDSTGWEDAVVWNPHLTMKDCYEVGG